MENASALFSKNQIIERYEEEVIDQKDLHTNGLLISDYELSALRYIKICADPEKLHSFKMKKNTSLHFYASLLIKNNKDYMEFCNLYKSFKLKYSIEVYENVLFAVYKGKSADENKPISMFFQKKYLFKETSDKGYFTVKIAQALEDNPEANIFKGRLFTRKCRSGYLNLHRSSPSILKQFKYLTTKNSFYKSKILYKFKYGLPLNHYSLQEAVCDDVSKQRILICSALMSYQRFNVKGLYTHRDISPQNIIFNPKNNKCKVIGLDYVQNNNFKTDIAVGDIDFMPPEILFHSYLCRNKLLTYSYLTDIYSLGLTLLSIFFSYDFYKFCEFKKKAITEKKNTNWISEDIMIVDENKFNVYVKTENNQYQTYKIQDECQLNAFKAMSGLLYTNPMDRIFPAELLDKEFSLETGKIGSSFRKYI